LQLTGLIILLFGTAVYNGDIITFSDMTEITNTANNNAERNKIETGLAMASPSLLRSPFAYSEMRKNCCQGDEAELELLNKKQVRNGGGGYQAVKRPNEV